MKKIIITALLLFTQTLTYSQVVANQPNNIVVCDDDVLDGLALFNLELQTEEILASQDPLNFSVTYHDNQSDAENNTSYLAEQYYNLTNPQTIFARVTDVNNLDYYATTNFEIVVINCQDDGEDDDDDNDEILTINEDYNLNGDPTDDDTDNSGIADYLEANVALSVNGADLNLFKVFPNPVLDKLFIQGLSNPTKISVYNVLGRLVLSKITSSIVDVDNLQSGIYIIKIVVEQKEVVRKFIKN